MSQGLNIGNEEVQDELEQLFIEIDHNQIPNEKEIAKQILDCIKKLKLFDQESVLEFIANKYKNRQFLNYLDQNQVLPDPSRQMDIFEELENYKKNQDKKGILALLDKQVLYEQKLIPNVIKSIVPTLTKLDQPIVLLIVEIIQHSVKKIDLSQICLLRKLLKLKYCQPNGLQPDEQKKIELAAGLLLKQQIFEFENYIQSQQNIGEMITQIQVQQQNNQIQQVGLSAIIRLFTENFKEPNYLDEYLLKVLSISPRNLQFDQISLSFEEFIRKENDISEIYYKVVIYYWGISCEYLIDYKQKRIKKFPVDEAIKESVLQLYMRKHNCEKEIPSYFFDRFVFFKDQLLLNNFNQYLKQQKQIQLQLAHQLKNYNLVDIIRLWRDIQQLTWFEIKQMQYKDLILEIAVKILWINHRDQIAEKNLENTLFNRQYDFLSYNDFLEHRLGKEQDNLKKDLLAFKIILFYHKNVMNDELSLWKKPLDYWRILQITPQFLIQKRGFLQYPQNMGINLEDFNISLAEVKKDLRDQIIGQWIYQMGNTVAFGNLIPFYFNIIKRGESAVSFTSAIQDSFKRLQLNSKCLNIKALFQIFYNNSNDELKMMLLKLHSKYNPIPLLYQNLNLDSINSEFDLFTFNHLIFYIFPECFTIINFSLNEKKFETSDTCEINNNTIDIMFDFAFDNRNLAIADIHGQIPKLILLYILPLFKMWIIQMNKVEEIEENIKALEEIIKYSQANPLICFIVRDAQQQQQQQQEKQLFSGQTIQILYLQDLSNAGIDQQIKNAEIKSAQHFLYSKIFNYDSREDKYINKKKQLLMSKNNFKSLILSFAPKTEVEKKINSDILLINQLIQELKSIIYEELGFYSILAFPIRSLEYELKKTKYAISQLGYTDKFEREKFQELSAKVETLERKFKSQKPSNLLKLFHQIFTRENYYILYLWFSETVQLFNNKNYEKLNENNQQISKKLQESDQSQPKNQIEQLKLQLKKSQEEMQLKTVNIENFWRELIQQQQRNISQSLNLDAVQIAYELIKRGEPFEFLDGENLTINKEFIQKLALKFNENNEKVMILSALGPQSSGKSTVLNKIFGCHFLTSVGRTTKGINLQLLKIQNKDQFENFSFDYILLLDTEGFQNPNQKDPEFDKKITMLILAISNIIIVIVKGDIHQPEKELIATCVYNLSQLKDTFPSLKQLSWSFNQNEDVNNIEKFKEQLKEIFANLLVDNNEKLDFNDMLQNSGNNLQILGFATMNTQMCNSWNMQRINDTFSQVAFLKFINLLKDFVEKFKKTQSNLQGLSNFVSDIHNIWDTIQRLPDLLEFNELISQNQNKIMKENFDKEWINSISQLSQNLNIREELQSQLRIRKLDQDLDFDYYKKQVEQVVKQKLELIKKQLQEKLNFIKDQFKISKHICKKYENLLNRHIFQEDLGYSFQIFVEIEDFQIESIRNGSITKIDKFIKQLSDQKYMELQQSPQNVIRQFESLWEEYGQECQISFKNLFSIYQQHFISTLILTQKESHLTNSEYSEHLNFFNEQINEREPDDNEKKLIYIHVAEKQIANQNGFMMIPKEKKYQKYTKIFDQDLSNRISLQKKTNSLIKVTDCFEICNKYVCIEKDEFYKYLRQDLLKDLVILIKNQRINEEEITKFFNIFKLFEITHETKDLDEMIKYINLIKESPNCEELIHQKCQKFIQDLIFQNNIQTIKEDDFFVNYHQIYYRRLPYHHFDLKNFDKKRKDFTEFLKQIPQNHIAIIKEKLFRPKGQGFDQILFGYIINPKANQDYADRFRDIFPNTFNQLMKNSENGWILLFSQIYDFIRDYLYVAQMDQLRSNNQIHQFYQSRDIIGRIEKFITKFNKEFALFGVILRTIGERYIKYYSQMAIWRFGCYFKWKRFQQLQGNKDSLKIEQLERFKSEILKNKKQLSLIKARALSDQIIQSFKQKYFSDHRNLFIGYLQGKRQNTFSIIQQQDDLLNQLSTVQQLKYLQHHKEYLNEVVDNKVRADKQNINYELQSDFKKKLKSQLEYLELNLEQIIQNQLFQELKQKGASYLFQQMGYSDSYYERRLYTIIKNRIQGKPTPLLSELNKQYCQFFQQPFRNVDIPFLDETEGKGKNEEIQDLYSFLTELLHQVKFIKYNEKMQELDMNFTGTQHDIENLNRYMKGCQEVCPVCNRKCDQDFLFEKEKHRHSCGTGHQIRGIKNVQIQGKPSLFTCDEILNDDYISFTNTEIVMSWSDFKLLYPDWDFNALDQYKQQNQKRQQQIWNDQIGNAICEQFNLQYEQRFTYQRQSYFQEEVAQFIFAIEDSKSMKGQNFKICKDSILYIIKKFSQNLFSIISLLLYNIKVKTLIDSEYCNFYEQEKKINQEENSLHANIYAAFNKILEIIDKNKIYNFTKTYVLIHFTKVDSTLDESIDRMCKLPKAIRKTITIRFYSYISYDSMNLELIVEKLKKKFDNVESFLAYQPNVLYELFAEKFEFSKDMTEFNIS